MDQYISQIYSSLTNKTLDEAIQFFSQLSIIDANTGDSFFETNFVHQHIVINNVLIDFS